MGKRIECLDYLRGLLATSVMVYHYTEASVGIDEGSLLGKLGLYAVSTFFILSGLAMGLVYPMKTASEFKGYAIKRAFRIAPLFWVSVTVGLLLANRPYSSEQIFENYSLTFGYLSPGSYITQGAWSIGAEMVFYALFPIMVLTGLRWWLAGSLLLALWYAFVSLDPSADLMNQFRVYVEWQNHLFLFVGGVALSKCRWGSRPALLTALVGSALVFWLWPGSHVEQVTGVGRLVLSACCFAFVYAVYRLAPELKGFAGSFFAFFGRGSYSIYLLHPLVALVLLPRGLGYVGCAVATLALSAASYALLERPMMRLGSVCAIQLANREADQDTDDTAQGLHDGDRLRVRG